MAIKLPGGGGGATDPDFANVVLLLHMDGSDGSTTFTDSSSYARTASVSGNAQIDTAASKFGGSSGLFSGVVSGTGFSQVVDAVLFPDSTEFNMGSSDWTMEAWVNVSSLSASRCIFAHRDGSGGLPLEQWRINTDGTIKFEHNGPTNVTTVETITTNTWYHLAVVRNSGTVAIYINGVAATLTGTNNSTAYGDCPADVSIGAGADGAGSGGWSSPFVGHIDEFRWTIGTARYTANFTPPTEAFPDSAGSTGDISALYLGSTAVSAAYLGSTSVWSAGGGGGGGGGPFVALATGSSSIAATSTDGMTWTQQTLPASADWVAGAFGNGTFVAVADGGSIAATSTDGITWTQRSLPSSAEWYAVSYGNGVFVSVTHNGSGLAATSPDGITWTQRSVTTSSYNDTFRSIAFGNGLFVVPAQLRNIAYTSPDGITWTQRTLPATQDWFSIAYGNGLFVLPGRNSATSLVSSDGINWTQGTLPSSAAWFTIAYGNGVFVTISQSSSIAASSSDGITWTQHNLPSSNGCRSVTYKNGIFVAPVYDRSEVVTSPDGVNWTLQTLPTTAYWRSVF